jgi:hypothetical protein
MAHPRVGVFAQIHCHDLLGRPKLVIPILNPPEQAILGECNIFHVSAFSSSCQSLGLPHHPSPSRRWREVFFTAEVFLQILARKGIARQQAALLLTRETPTFIVLANYFLDTSEPSKYKKSSK